MKTPVSFYGGKQRIASQIVPYIWNIPHTVYAEPFAGGLAVLFAKGVKPVADRYYMEAINDIDNRLITLYRVMRTQPEEFNHWVQTTPYSQEEHRTAGRILKNPQDYSDLEIAWAYFVGINQGFSSRLDTGWSSGTISCNLAATWHQRKQRLPQCMERLQSVYIGCEDALRFMDHWDSPHTLFYCDPPYPEANQGHYDGYTMQDWQNLCNKLDSIDGSYILSNYPQPIEPKSAQQRVEIDAVMSASKTVREKRTEVLWICDRSHGIRDDLKRVSKPATSDQLTLFDQ
jgi:DNA adenine methylase